MTLGGCLTCLSFSSVYYKEGALAFEGPDDDPTEPWKDWAHTADQEAELACFPLVL